MKKIQILNNKTFEILVENFETYFKSIPFIDVYCFSHKMTVGEITKNRYVISLEFPFNSWVRFGSSEIGEKLELVSIRIAPEHQDKGFGTILMRIMFTFFNDCLGYIPQIQLECTGAIGIENEYLINPIQRQTKFFRAFGFRVTNRKEYPNYVKMEIDLTKIELDDLILNGNNQNKDAA
jgi:GNAT superfamily N-acetyltransferase